MSGKTPNIVKNLIETGRYDDEGKTIYACPKCKEDMEDITQAMWTNAAMYHCPKCQRNWEVLEDGE